MKISGVDIRPGNIIEYEGGIWKVAKIQHTQPGKGGAYMQVEMKNILVNKPYLDKYEKMPYEIRVLLGEEVVSPPAIKRDADSK